MGAATAPQQSGEQPQMKKNAITFVSNVVIGVASTAPGFSLATTIGLIVAIGGVGLHAPAVMLVSFVPMFFVAFAYRWMNKADTDAGTTFSWVTKAFGPHLGWIAGWGLLLADLVVMATQSQIAGAYSLDLVGVSQSTLWVTVIGVVWIVVMSAICYIGIEASARTQQGLLLAEIVTLLAFSVVALVKVYGGTAGGAGFHAIHPSLEWLNPFSVGSAPMLDGLLLGVFLYWGWDSGVSVNEETVDGANAPGKAAVLSTVLLLLIYVIVTVSAQAFAGADYLGSDAHSSEVFGGGLGTAVFGSPLDKLLIIAVLTSSAAATQTTILPAARTALSMARKAAIPSYFGEVHRKHQTPGHATIIFGVLSVIWFVVVNLLSQNVLADSLTGCGFLVCFYYGLTGYACVWYFRHELRKSLKNFVLVGLLPFLGALALTGVFVKACIEYVDPANGSGEAIFGIGLPFVIGVGLLLMGVVAMAYANFAHRPFFVNNSQRETADPALLAES
ncbi:MAG: APC family permease [Solirubrobacterales bacterium]|nr:APC family permease [Solirubrobacterales bacterium]